MATTLSSTPVTRRRGHNGDFAHHGGDDFRRPHGGSPRNHLLAMVFLLAAVGMLFIGLTSAYVVREGLGGDWRRLPLPRILLVNTALLMVSSVTIEGARQAIRHNDRKRGGERVTLTLLLGVLFVGGQLLAWQSLTARGILLSSEPHGSFFYVLTGLHGAHLIGGLVALAITRYSLWREHPLHPERWVEATAVYWHFMDVLWVFLFVLLFVLG